MLFISLPYGNTSFASLRVDVCVSIKHLFSFTIKSFLFTWASTHRTSVQNTMWDLLLHPNKAGTHWILTETLIFISSVHTDPRSTSVSVWTTQIKRLICDKQPTPPAAQPSWHVSVPFTGPAWRSASSYRGQTAFRLDWWLMSSDIHTRFTAPPPCREVRRTGVPNLKICFQR